MKHIAIDFDTTAVTIEQQLAAQGYEFSQPYFAANYQYLLNCINRLRKMALINKNEERHIKQRLLRYVMRRIVKLEDRI